MVSSMMSALILLPFLTISQHESGSRKSISWSVTVYNKNLSSQCNMTAQIEPLQDKLCLSCNVWQYYIRLTLKKDDKHTSHSKEILRASYSCSALIPNNYITSVFHWNVTIWLVMKWSHDYKRDVLHPNKTQTRTCTCLHDDVRCKQSMA
jgi:hypothetical protein